MSGRRTRSTPGTGELWLPGPTAPRMVLGIRLRRFREEHELTGEQAAARLGVSASKISRLELGRHGFKVPDLLRLLDLYGVQDPVERETLLVLAEQANTPGWWHPYGDVVPPWFEDYLGLEQAAKVIRSFEAQTVHPLLQTPDYAEADLRNRYRDEPAARLERRLELRMRRQEVLRRPGGPRLWTILDEAALRRPAGGRSVMRAQFDQMLELAERPNVTIQIVPFYTGPHPAVGGPVTILRLHEALLPGVVYLEQPNGALYPDDVFFYRELMDRLGTCAATPEETAAHLHRIFTEL